VSRNQYAYAENGAERGDAPAFDCCASCGERIGIYERLLYELPDRSLVLSGLLSVPASVKRLGGRVRYFHAACAPPRAHLHAVED